MRPDSLRRAIGAFEIMTARLEATLSENPNTDYEFIRTLPGEGLHAVQFIHSRRLVFTLRAPTC